MSYAFNNDKSRFPLGSASDLPDPSKTPMEIIGELQNQIIDSASIENGATASKAYASGDYVCFQGALCKASKAISQGDTLSIGDSANDNLTLTDAAAEFARINSDLSALKYKAGDVLTLNDDYFFGHAGNNSTNLTFVLTTNKEIPISLNESISISQINLVANGTFTQINMSQNPHTITTYKRQSEIVVYITFTGTTPIPSNANNHACISRVSGTITFS